MNKTRILAITVLVIALVFALASCSEKHEHAYTSEVTAPTCTADGFTTYTCSCGDSYTADKVDALGHEYSTVVTEPTCTADGYTTYTCTACGDNYTADTVTAPGHSYNSVVTDPTCTEDGYTTHTCADCNHSYKDNEIPAAHKYDAVVTNPTCTVDGYTTHTCSACGDSYTDSTVTAPGHSYTPVVTEPTCTATGYTTHTCSGCGDSYTDSETDMIPHVDLNLDITCDYDGCTKRILPAADSEISLFTANHMIIMSLTSNYYVQGVVTEVLDIKNGIFVITDEAGDSILIRLPKDANGTAYSAWGTLVILGDTVRVYGKPTANTSTATSTEKAKIEGGVLTVVSHTHNFSDPDCKNPATCDCLATDTPALGHSDTNGDGYCDRCTWNMSLTTTSIAVSTDTSVTNGVLDANKTSWTWTDGEFNVVVAKGTSTYTLYTNAKAYMQLKKLNTLTVSSEAGHKIAFVTIYASNSTQLKNLKDAIGTQYEYTADEIALSVTITLDAVESFVLVNNGPNTAYINNVEIAYVPTNA